MFEFFPNTYPNDMIFQVRSTKCTKLYQEGHLDTFIFSLEIVTTFIFAISAILKSCLKNIFIFNSHGKLESEMKSGYNLGLEGGGGGGGHLSAVRGLEMSSL